VYLMPRAGLIQSYSNWGYLITISMQQRRVIIWCNCLTFEFQIATTIAMYPNRSLDSASCRYKD
jgi:hypothetical protein